MATQVKYQNKLIQEKSNQLSFEEIIQEITITESDLTECKAQKDFNREVLKNKMETSEDATILRSQKEEDGVVLKQMTMDVNDYNLSYADYKRVSFNKDIVLDTARVVDTLMQRDIDSIERMDISEFDGLDAQQIKDRILEAIRKNKGLITNVINSFDSATTTTVYDRLDIGYNKKKAPR